MNLRDTPGCSERRNLRQIAPADPEPSPTRAPVPGQGFAPVPPGELSGSLLERVNAWLAAVRETLGSRYAGSWVENLPDGGRSGHIAVTQMTSRDVFEVQRLADDLAGAVVVHNAAVSITALEGYKEEVVSPS